MRRSELEHVLRAAAKIAEDPEILVIGSQSILGSADEQHLPAQATASMEVDIAFFDDPDNDKSDRVDGAIGELSMFHETYGYYAQGVSVDTATLPSGWRDRLIVIATDASSPGRGLCLDPHDCVVSKLVAGREKDHLFAAALIGAGVVVRDTLEQRLAMLEEVDARVVDRARQWLATF